MEGVAMKQNEQSHFERDIERLAAYLQGFGDAKDSQRMRCAAHWLEELAKARVCSGGIVGCQGGQGCTSDHK